MSLYLGLQVGKDTPTKEDGLVGESGPVFEMDYVGITIGSTFRAKPIGQESLSMFLQDGFLYYDGKYYGDVVILDEKAMRRLSSFRDRLADFDRDKLIIPDSEVTEDGEEPTTKQEPSEKFKTWSEVHKLYTSRMIGRSMAWGKLDAVGYEEEEIDQYINSWDEEIRKDQVQPTDENINVMRI